MADRFEVVLRGGICATPSGLVETDIGVRDGRIAALGPLNGAIAETVIDVRGLHVLPGVIDTQVHFREPGNEHKEDLATGTAGAALGGVVGIFEMPNTKPSTTTKALLDDKLARARGRAWVDHAFFIGAARENVEDLGGLERLPGCAGVKMFMGSSTGTLLVPDDDGVFAVLRNGHRRVAVHAEDEERLVERRKIAVEGGRPHLHPLWRDEETALRAVKRLIALARRAGRRVHVLHVTSAGEMDFLALSKDIATVETTPQHLTLTAPECYDRLGTLAQMNPPIRDKSHWQALWRAVREGVVDVIGSDHAPHTLEEKAKPYPESPSGMTGVQTLVPILLDHVNAGRLSLERFVDLTSVGPARVYGVVGKGRIACGYDADFTIVDLKERRRIENRWIASRCGWTPFDGLQVIGWPKMTMLRGNLVMREDELIGSPAGRPVRFLETLAPEP
ncbi:MAG TPA: dihydroorotase [Alphaproteobacteria bacterium]|nr:dihydroorotase [Alphaproteobacteria bacterium]